MREEEKSRSTMVTSLQGDSYIRSSLSTEFRENNLYPVLNKYLYIHYAESYKRSIPFLWGSNSCLSTAYIKWCLNRKSAIKWQRRLANNTKATIRNLGLI